MPVKDSAPAEAWDDSGKWALFFPDLSRPIFSDEMCNVLLVFL